MDIFTLEFWKGLWVDFVEFLTDLPIKLLKLLLDALAGLLESLTPPEFMATSIGDVLGPVQPYIGYFVSQSGVGQAMGILAAGLAFRLARKLLTLGQW